MLEEEGNLEALGDDLDLAEAEYNAVMSPRPKPFTDPNWEQHFGWDSRHDVRKARAALNLAAGIYSAELSWRLLVEATEMPKRSYHLRQLWRMWDALVESRKAVVAVPVDASMRTKIDAYMVYHRDLVLYDTVRRRFYGVKELTWDDHVRQDAWGRRVPAPKTKPQRPRPGGRKRPGSDFNTPFGVTP